MTAPYSPIADTRSRIQRARAYVSETLAEVRRVEGERGMATRASVCLRYLSYLIGIYLTAFIVGALPAFGPLATRLLLVSCAVIVITAAFGTIAYPVERRNIVEQARTFLFAVVCFPSLVLGVLVSVVGRGSSGLGGAVTSNDALMVNLMQNALPYLFWATVVVPPFIFAKTIFGLRKLHRERMDDEELMSLWTRQDEIAR